MTERSDQASPLTASAAAGRTLRYAWCVTMALLALVILQCVVSISPDLHWIMDPRSQPEGGAVTQFGLAEMALLQVLTVLLAGMGMALHRMLGGRWHWPSVGLAVLGIVIAILQPPLWGGGHIDDLSRSIAWIGAASAGLAFFHLAQHPLLRRWITATCLALTAPLLAGAVYYTFVSHPLTVQNFEFNAADIFRAQGIEPGSPQAIMFERRLRFSDATGAFGLSNVFGTILAALTMLAIGLTAAAAMAKQWRRLVLPAVMVILAGFALSLTRSRGAILSVIVVTPLVLAGVAAWRVPSLRRLLPVAALALLIAAIGAVMLRGLVGPPDTAEGERSMLFRYHYWTASARIYSDAPAWQKLVGVGPAGFTEAYLFHKDPLNPEDIRSPHNVFVDWIVMHGLGGVAWSALLCLWLWHAARGAAQTLDDRQLEADDCDDPLDTHGHGEGLSIAPRDLIAAASFGVVVFGLQAWKQWPQMLHEAILAWVIATAAFVLILALAVTPGVMPRQGVRLGWFAAAMALLLHSQIEMAFYTYGAMAAAWCVVAVAAGVSLTPAAPAAGPKGKAMPVLDSLGIGAGLAVLLLVCGWWPLNTHQRLLAEAADHRRAGDDALAIAGLRAATESVGLRDPQVVRRLVQLQLELAQRHIEQGDPAAAIQLVTDAQAALQRAAESGITTVTLRRAEAGRLQFMAHSLGQPQRIHDAAATITELLRHTPYNMQDHERLGDIYWQLEAWDQAATVYRRLLTLDDQAYLDPARQLSPSARQRIEARLTEAEQRAATR